MKETLKEAVYQNIGLAANQQGIINQALATSNVMKVLQEKMYSDEYMIDFSEWVSLNFPNQHNYLRNLQKRSQGLDVPIENLKGYYSTKELFEQYKKK